MLANPKNGKEKFLRPGHIFPIEAHKKGLSARQGHSEAAIALCHLTGCYPAGVLCEILKKDGHMARVKDLVVFKKNHNLKMINIKFLNEFIKNKIILK
jgi:3,4-dihydroxy-2-butanone 4-phosphate synthase